MSKLKTAGKAKTSLGQVIQHLSTAMSERGKDFAREEHVQGILSLESLEGARLVELERQHGDLSQQIQDAYKAAGITVEGYTSAQWEAGGIAALAAGNPGMYAEAASSIRQVSVEGINVVDAVTTGAGGQLDYRYKASMEAFDERELRNFIPFSIAFNVQAARQGEFAEAFYPTTVITPDQAGLDVTVRRTMVFNEIRHDLTGKAMDFGRRNLVDAVVDASILANTSTLVVPRLVAGTNDTQFALNGTVAVQTGIVVDGATIDTAPLKSGVTIDLLGISQRAAEVGQMDMTDALDVRMNLKAIYLHGGSFTAAAGDEPVKFDISRAPRAQFIKSAEGLDREMMLNFVTTDLPITTLTTATDAAAPTGTFFATYLAGLANAANYIIRLGVNIGGSANVELGNVQVIPGPVTIDSMWYRDPATGEITAAAPAVLAGARAAFGAAVSVVGYDLFATRSNLNRRNRGLLVTTLEVTERHTIPLGAPITAPSPINSNRDASDLTALISAARIRNDNNAVTQLLNYADMLKALQISTDRSVPVPAIEGIGRHLVRPFYEEVDLDMLEHINSIKSHERAADVSAAIVNTIRDVLYRAYRESGYQPALDALTGGSGEKPTVIIGTDPVIQRHLIIGGDTRLAGIGFDHEVVTSMDKRVYGKIFVTFSRKGQTGPDPMSFGCHAWMPELASTVQVTRNGATIKEAMVQPRQRHVNTLPVLMVLNVTNLAEAVARRLALQTDEMGVANGAQVP